MIIVGIDPSLTHTGLCRLTDGKILNEKKDLLAIKSKAVGDSIANRLPRMFEIRRQILNFCLAEPVSLFSIEGYAFRANGRVFDLGEFGGLIREELLALNIPIVEVGPTRLKKFITGQGNCDKALVMKEVERIYKFKTDDDNLSDAFAIAIYAWSYHCLSNNIKIKLNSYQKKVLSEDFLK